jgi:release factor glutamine methyltransferase
MTMDETGFQRGSFLLDKHLTDTARPDEFHLLDRTWDLMDGVFSPVYTPITGLLTSWLPFPPGGTFLEVGSGTGVTSVVAAQSGCRSVTALDISAAAVENTRRNVERHKVADRVRVLHSDLFSALEPGERFDIIYWNSNFAEAPADFVNKTDLYHAFFDPGYDAHRRFVQEAPAHLAPGGRLMLGFCSIGSLELLTAICAEAGFDVDMARSARHQTQTSLIDFQLLELTRARDRAH